YHMWFGGHDGSNNRQIGYATSPDGITWTKYSGNPVLTPGSSSWDDIWVDSPEVLFINGVFHMWYSGYDGVNFQSGHATSSDGTNWTKDPLNPVLESGDYQPAVLFDGDRDTYYMWYSSGDALGWSVGYAYSMDGSTWNKYPENPVMEPGPNGSWDEAFTGLFGVIFNEDSTVFKMWYTGAGASAIADWDIGYATAPNNHILPVELMSFTALANSKEVLLNWSTATELNNLGFEIQRNTSGKEFFTVGFVNGHGTTSEQQNYRYTDKNLNSGKYYYRLKQIDYDGSYEYSDVIEVEWRVFDTYLLDQNYPNPFNPATIIGFGVRENSNIKITVLNSIGEEVGTLLNENKEPGFYQVEFSASNLPSGIYFYQLKAGSFVETKKMILLR
ncbi:MAG: T9SS type A sorting domain-containing protein, partial [Ignavibacteriaceae bacterium]